MGLWKWTLSLFLILNLKSLIFSWHLRFFWALWRGICLHRNSAHHLQPRHILLPTICTSQTTLMEMDFNLHKSNSTYFTDLDIVRAYHSGVLFGPLFMPRQGGKRCNLIVSAVLCNFKRKVKPLRGYEISTKVVSWDEKWIYMVTHFVEHGRTGSSRGLLETGPLNGMVELSGVVSRGTQSEGVLASAITRLVCKRGRMTMPPIRVLKECNILPHQTGSSDPSDMENISLGIPEDVELYRTTNLSVAQLRHGWDKVHELFCEQERVLGRHGYTL
ncbi:hypothetical protein BS50DRAFT_653844 [Corynespora cassiicola Philippines]|uniref:Thioesterase/thiol ester dehydrase-isomerase n=1 Tax=Corynespora cassiicola Philippines TaxID=1448308 RepID=A0A2T2P6Y0_CORCC|nr:hypothetical protein BS50DRAFT_653844 [Corynespora cassiicola Philippines]